MNDTKPARVSSLIEPSVWLEPKIVIEVLADEITRSPIHTAGKVGDELGYALRFPNLEPLTPPGELLRRNEPSGSEHVPVNMKGRATCS